MADGRDRPGADALHRDQRLHVAIDGTSLTVVDTGPDWFNVTLINYTQAEDHPAPEENRATG